MIFPNYDHSILSVSASVLAHYGVESDYPTLPELTAALEGRKKVLMIVADGLGSTVLRETLPETAYLRRHTQTTVTSVFPPTTPAATTSYYSGKSPFEHGWLGWHLYFKEYAAEIVTFFSTGFYKECRYQPAPAPTLMPYRTLFQQIGPQVKKHVLCGFPAYFHQGADMEHRISTIEQGCAALRRIAEVDEDAFALLYWTQPDATMHDTGVHSPEAKAAYREVNNAIERLSAQIFADGRDDTILLVVSDHGLIDAAESIDIAQMPKVAQLLIMPPSIEERAAAFFVKPHRMADFRAWFDANLAEDFIFLTREEVYARELFGRGTPHPKFDDFIGDAMIIATGHRCLKFSVPGMKPEKLIGHHAGLSEAEMLVDVIIDTGKSKE